MRQYRHAHRDRRRAADTDEPDAWPIPSHGGGWDLLTPAEALSTLEAGDVAIGRLDVLPTLDGIDDGLWALGELDARGVRVLNGPSTLLATHDKLLTARLLARAGLPHPRTCLVVLGGDRPQRLSGSVVVKPRFGSWGSDVDRCEGQAAFEAHLHSLRHRPWFQRQGALVQELVTPRGYDLRLVVAADRVVGAVIRVAADGEWRTNVALGAHRLPTMPPPRRRSSPLPRPARWAAISSGSTCCRTRGAGGSSSS